MARGREKALKTGQTFGEERPVLVGELAEVLKESHAQVIDDAGADLVLGVARPAGRTPDDGQIEHGGLVTALGGEGLVIDGAEGDAQGRRGKAVGEKEILDFGLGEPAGKEVPISRNIQAPEGRVPDLGSDASREFRMGHWISPK